MSGAAKVSQIPGRKKGTDKQILAQYKKTPFLHYVQTKYKVGMLRLRRIVREHEKKEREK